MSEQSTVTKRPGVEFGKALLDGARAGLSAPPNEKLIQIIRESLKLDELKAYSQSNHDERNDE